MILFGEKKRSHRFDARPDIALSNTPCGLGRDESSLLSALRKSRGTASRYILSPATIKERF